MTVRKPLVLVNGEIRQIPDGDTVPATVTYNGGTDPIISTFSGPVTPFVGISRYYHPTPTSIVSMYASVGTASTAGNIYVSLNMNGVAIATCSIVEGAHVSSPITISSPLTPADYLTVDISAPGTGAHELMVYIVVDAGSPVQPSIASVPIVLSMPGNVIPTVGTLRRYPSNDLTLTQMRAVVSANVDTPVNISLKRNDILVSEVTIDLGMNDSGIQPINIPLTTTDYLTVDISASCKDLVVALTSTY